MNKIILKIDHHDNALELYSMMHAKGLCIGCADLYRAWAFYYEATGDYRRANDIFELGKKVLAQPYDALEAAHENMIYAAGQQVCCTIQVQF